VRVWLVMLALPVVLAAADAKVYSGKLLDYNEETYSDRGAFDGSLCVHRDHKIDAGDMILVLRQSTCSPRRLHPPLNLTIGDPVQLVNHKDGRIGILDGKRKPVWMRVYKRIRKGES
jgi:hypothetical protein